MTLIYKINDLERKMPYKQWEALKKEFVEFAKDKKQIETNWNELKDWLEYHKVRPTALSTIYAQMEYNFYEGVLNKMKELERGKE